MLDKRNIERLEVDAAQKQQRLVNQKAERAYKAEMKRREARTPEKILADTAMECVVGIKALADIEAQLRVRLMDIILGRDEKIARVHDKRVGARKAFMYSQPHMDSTEERGRSMELLVSRTISKEQYEEAKQRQRKLPPLEPAYLQRSQKDALFVNLPIDSTDINGVHRYTSRWQVQHIHQDRINKNNPYGLNLKEGSFHDVDIFRETNDGERVVRSRAYHMRINGHGHSLRAFHAFEEDGEPKDKLLVMGGDDLDVALGILQHTSDYLAREVAILQG